MTDWESICRGCGLCCHEKIITADKYLVLDPDWTCEFLDKCTNRCTIYKDRLKKNKRCHKVTPLFAAFSHSLPPVCGYVIYMRKHHLRFAKVYPAVIAEIDD